MVNNTNKKNHKKELVAKCDRLEKLKHSSVNPYAYTEQGVAMLATVLKSDVAVKVSIAIMDAFVEMHKIQGPRQKAVCVQQDGSRGGRNNGEDRTLNLGNMGAGGFEQASSSSMFIFLHF